jgi:hypothetical protein
VRFGKKLQRLRKEKPLDFHLFVGGIAHYLFVYMTTLCQKIGEEFLSRLAKSPEIDSRKLERLRLLIAQGKRLRAPELVIIFSDADVDEKLND